MKRLKQAILTLISTLTIVFCLIAIGQQIFVSPAAAKKTKIPKGMVLIPEGKFMMGSENGGRDEVPLHEVFVEAFYIDVHEVTNRMFKQFVDANPQWSKEKLPAKFSDGDYLKHWRNSTYPPKLADHPVIYVSWYAADAYTKWVGKELPDEIKWEKAASINFLNAKMGKEYKHKWAVGNVIDPYLANTAHYHGLDTGGFWSYWWVCFKQDIEQKMARGKVTTEVGRFPPGVNNLYDMTGNVWEWCQDWYQGDAYERRKISLRRSYKAEDEDKGNYERLYEPSSSKDFGLLSGTYRVVRGGSWADNDSICRTANRYKLRPDFTSDEVGFRCVKVVR